MGAINFWYLLYLNRLMLFPAFVGPLFHLWGSDLFLSCLRIGFQFMILNAADVISIPIKIKK